MQPRGSQFQQLKMFMSPREVLRGYQPLDADRGGAHGSQGPVATASTGTGIGTAMNTAGDNVRHGRFRMGHDTGGTFQASTYGTRYRARAESHDEMMDRKLSESMGHGEAGEGSWDPMVRRQTRVDTSWYGSDTYVPPRGERMSAGEETLHESVGKHGVTHPISLGTGGKPGMLGKPQIVGGHHRVAAQFDQDPDRLMPVLHYTDIKDAMGAGNRGGARYT
jgi:hypothetical protein